MQCPKCQHENRDRAKFCEECAAPLKRACASCGAELRPTAKFCDECAAPTAASAARQQRSAEPASARKVVTVVFADLVGSTALHERVDAESARRLMERYYETLRTVVEQHGGTIVKLLGDGVMAAFGVPQVAEDDAIRAVRAAVAMQEAFRALVGEQAAVFTEVGLRVAVNTGEVVVSGANDDIVGDPVNVAARLQQEARDGDVVIGDATRPLVASLVTLEPLGSFALKGRSEEVTAYRVESLERPVGAAATPFVGRDAELARITAVYAAAAAAPAARLAVLLGSPGLGKSRLIAELGLTLGDSASIIGAHCDATGSATFAPLTDALREFLEIDDSISGDALSSTIESSLPSGDSERKRIASGVASLLAGAPASPEETFFVVRRLLASFAARKPVVLVIDDLQWAEPLLLDLVEHLIQWGSDVALFVLVGARPELREARSSLATPGGLVTDVITLDGLDAGAATRLAAHVIGASDLPAAVAAKVLATSEGNPLFVGELVRMLVHEGVLTREGDRWIVSEGLASFEMPPTIHALLAARIERLHPEDRIILERAAVIGRQFSRSAVAELVPVEAGDLDARLESLRRSELIERDVGWFLGEPVLRFHHVLIRDAAYRRLLKETRTELHARFADWIEVRAGGSIEHDETIGWHLEQAHQLLGELGPIDDAGRALGERAAQRLAAAGRRALARDDVSLAANLLGRALDRLDTADPARADLALDACEALLAAGEVGPAGAVIEELDRFATSSERLRAWHTCFVGQLTALTAPEELHATADAVAAAAEQLAALDDTAGEAKAHFVHAQALARLGKVGACEAALDRALAAARSAGDRRRANAVLAGAPLAALWGPSPVTRASGRCLDVVRVLRITQGAPAVESVALSCQGVLEALRGRTDAARRMIASSRKMVEELGISHRLFEADVFAARIDLLEGKTDSAERGLRGAYEGLRDLGLGIDAARAAALLARTLLAKGRAAEAETLSHESEALAGDDLQAAIAWRGVRAEALAQRGEIDGAIELAQAAVEIATATDALLDHADARLALAAALRAAGRAGEADAEERHALDLWETKGATLLAERARGDAGRVVAEVDPAQEIAAETAGKALVRPAEIAAETARTRPVHLRVRPNAASVWRARLDAAVAAHDVDGLLPLFSESYEEMHHPTGATYGRGAVRDSLKRLLRSQDGSLHHELLATLGERLELSRETIHASGTGKGRFDVGEYEIEALSILEVDVRGHATRSEAFAGDSLADATARLYERYAEQLTDGPARDRAAMTARAVAVMLTRSTAPRVEDVLASDLELVDHRMLGYGTLRGADLTSRWRDATDELTQDRAFRVTDVLALSTDALLRRTTSFGKVRASGGAFEIVFLSLSVFGPGGRLARHEMFDVGHEAEALGRFDELTAELARPRPSLRRVRPNAASAAMERLEAAIQARDLDAVDALCGDPLETVDHPGGATYGREGQIESTKRMMRLPDLEFRTEALATIGEVLCLCRRIVSASGTSGGDFDVAEYEMEHVIIVEVDEAGRSRSYEVFAPDHLNDAIGRLYERYAELLPDGPDRDRSATTARTVAAYLDTTNLDGWSSLVAPTLESVDHRILGTWGARGAKELRAHFDSLFALAADIVFCTEDVLAVEPGTFLVRVVHSGTTRAGGGAYERPFLLLGLCGSEGLLTRSEYFDVDHEADALVRFDELTAGKEPLPAARFVNAVSRTAERVGSCWAARDWKGIEGAFSPALRFEDRRRLNRIAAGAKDFLVQLRMLFDLPESRWEGSLVATRGEHLALARVLYRAEVGEGGGPLELAESFNLVESGADGRIIAAVDFDLEDEDAAYAELEARYAASEAAEYPLARAYVLEFARAFESRDWDAMARLGAPDQVAHNHRLVGWGTLEGSDVWVRPLQELVALAADVQIRGDHLRLSERGMLTQLSWWGTRDGGAFETSIVIVTELNEDGRHRRMDIWDANRVDAAFARFEEIAAGTSRADSPPARFANAATRATDRQLACFRARDWLGFAEPMDASFKCSDRRRMARIDLDRDGYVEMTRALGDMESVSLAIDPLATRGDRLFLYRARIEVADGDVGPSGLEHLNVVETDERGDLLVGGVRFDIDDLDAAYAELDRLYYAGEAAAHAAHGIMTRTFLDAVATGDWDPVIALCSPDFIEYDHRHLAVLGTTRGADAWTKNFSTLAELAPDTIMPFDHLRSTAGGFYFQVTWRGTREGGDYEIPLIGVMEEDGQGRYARADIYDLDQLDEMQARFEDLAAPAASQEPFSNTAFRVWQEIGETWQRRDVQRFTDLHPSPLRYRDHRRQFQLDLDREQFLEFTLPLLEMAATASVQLLATRGERLVLTRFTMEIAEDPVGPSAIDSLVVIETDEKADISAYERYDLDDLDDAYAQLDALWEAGEATVHAKASAWLAEFRRAFASRDWDAMAVLDAPDHVAHNHRLVGWGTLRGAGAWIRTLQELVALAPDVQQRVDHVRSCERGVLFQFSWEGTRDGGAFETPLVTIFELNEEGLQQRFDVWDADSTEAALARFEEIHSATVDPASRFANSATRAAERSVACWSARDWARLAQILPAEFRFYDRQRFSQLELDRDELVAFTRRLGDMATTRVVAELVATRGDRLTLMRLRIEVAGGDVGPSETCHLNLFETDEYGQVVALVRFDVGDLDAAYAELDARWEAGEATAYERVSATMRALFDAFATRDWDAFTALHAPDFVRNDRRILGLGPTSDPREIVRTQEALFELAPDARLRRPDHIRISDRAFFMDSAIVGTREGGAFEMPALAVFETDDLGKLRRADLYDPEQYDAARARFEEIAASATSAQTPPAQFRNTASRAWGKILETWRTRDVERFAQGHPRAFRYRDHRRLYQLDFDRDEYLEFARPLLEMRDASASTELLATRGDRLTLERLIMEVADESVGPSAIESLLVIETDEWGELAAFDRYDEEDLDAAYAELDARYAVGEGAAHGIVPAASSARAAHDPLATIAKPNAATATLDRWDAAFEAGFASDDWDAMRQLCSPAMAFEDRQRLALVSGDRELMIASARERAAVGARPERRLIGTAGERVGVWRMLWSGGPADGRFEIENRSLVEVDESGLIAAIVLFDLDDARGAQREAWARWSAIDPVATQCVDLVSRSGDSLNDRDLTALRAILAEDIVVDDRRRTGFGRIEGRDAYFEALAALWELAPDTRVEVDWYWPACDRHAAVTTNRRSGTIADGGAYESDYLILHVMAGGLVTRIEVFELDALDTALARFEELRPDPLRISPNTATQSRDR